MLRLACSLLLISCFSFSIAQTPIAHFSFDNDSDSTKTKELVSNTVFSIANHYDRPERIDGIDGKALRLDGFSTWASNNNFSLSSVTNTMAIEAWFATEAFNEKSVGLVSQHTSNAGFSLKVTSFGNVIFEFYANGIKQSVRTVQQLERYKWHHIVAQVDLLAEEATIYVNNALWKTQTIRNRSVLSLANSANFYVGRTNDTDSYSGFLLVAANGAIDEVKMYNQTLTTAQIQTNYNVGANKEVDLFIDPNIRHANDYLRPRYHPMPNTSWTNEPYGLTYFDSTYHLFFQKNANSPALYFMHWGHISSPDLVNWKEEKMALWPLEGFSDFGVWSGTTFFDDNDEPVISYTGVDGQRAGIGMAYPQDSGLIAWQRMPTNSVIQGPPTSVPNMDFRDPYIWKAGGKYYMVVGSGRANNGGGILFTYESTDLTNWTNIPPLYESANTSESGIFWEMPAFFQLSQNTWVLVITPVMGAGRRAETQYWVGTYSPGNAFQPFNSKPEKFEHLTRHMLSPAFGPDENGDMSYIGIVPDDRDGNLQIEAGWRHTFTLPRVVRLLEDTLLGHYPHPNLCRLRDQHTQVLNRTFMPNSNFNLPEFSGNQVELEATLIPEENSEFFLQVLKNQSATEFTSITFNLEYGNLGINRVNSSPYPTAKDNRFFPYNFGDTIRLRVFIDHSILEVFVDNLTVMSARVYPGEQSLGVDLVVPQGEVFAPQMDFWTLRDKEASQPDSTCPPAYLPSKFFTTSIRELLEDKDAFHVFPNPSTDRVSIRCEACPDNRDLWISVWDSQGRMLEKMDFQGQKDLYLKPYGKGLFLIQLSDGMDSVSRKIIIQ